MIARGQHHELHYELQAEVDAICSCLQMHDEGLAPHQLYPQTDQQLKEVLSLLQDHCKISRQQHSHAMWQVLCQLSQLRFKGPAHSGQTFDLRCTPAHDRGYEVLSGIM